MYIILQIAKLIFAKNNNEINLKKIPSQNRENRSKLVCFHGFIDKTVKSRYN